MADRLTGAPVAAALTETLKGTCAALRERGVSPVLTLVRVGAREDDLAYERAARKRCAEVGIETRQELLPEAVTQTELLAVIRRLNEDAAVHGVLLFRPLPKHLDETAVCAALSPEKDVDGITAGSMAGVFTGSGTGYPPCTAQACIELMDYYGIGAEGRRVVVVGRSLVIGRPVAMLLLRQNATVTLCHTRTANLAEECRRADILVAAAGKAGIIGGDCVSPGQIILDVGIHVREDGSLCGDVDFDAAEPLAGAITPVPGGVGSVTTCVLAAHVAAAAKRELLREGRNPI